MVIISSLPSLLVLYIFINNLSHFLNLIIYLILFGPISAKYKYIKFI